VLFFTRWGILVPVIAMIVLPLVEYLTETAFHDANYYQNHAWPKVMGCLLLAEIYWLVGRRLNRNATLHIVDPVTGEETIVSHEHTFFHFPIELWAFVALIMGVIALFG